MAANINWDENTLVNWYDQFIREHGYAPDEDPNLLAKGFSPEQAVAEHMRAAEFGVGFQEMYGRPPTVEDYEYNWYETYTPWVPWVNQGGFSRVGGRDGGGGYRPYWMALRLPTLPTYRGAPVPKPPSRR